MFCCLIENRFVTWKSLKSLLNWLRWCIGFRHLACGEVDVCRLRGLVSHPDSQPFLNCNWFQDQGRYYWRSLECFLALSACGPLNTASPSSLYRPTFPFCKICKIVRFVSCEISGSRYSPTSLQISAPSFVPILYSRFRTHLYVFISLDI